ncbi:MAG: lipopolysaccharide assembly protein LapB [Gammaproteobacteria bacterium]|jgi:lipopolysaccharide biosynthesis regulator YciM
MLPSNQAFLLAGLFLLIAAAGWLFGRFGEGNGSNEENGGNLSSDYLKGLNFLLNEQTDQALDLFLKVVRVDDDTLETHFALGSLFRRRGEVDRAIRIHQNIIARPDLSAEQRDEALHALARDYLRAGLLDRAEKMYESLAENSAYREEALLALCGIYEQEQDWEKAIDAGERLERIRGGAVARRVPHYYCELAEQAIERGELQRARGLLKQAWDRKNPTVRGALDRARIAREQGDTRMALRLYRRTLEENPDFLVEVLPRLAELLEADGRLGDLQEEIAALIAGDPEYRSAIAYGAILHDLRGPVIDECVEEYILTDPTLAAFVAGQELAKAGPEARHEAVARIREGLAVLARRSPRYRCRECGFSSMQLLWQCPSCKAWETQRPADKVRFDSLLRQSGTA